VKGEMEYYYYDPYWFIRQQQRAWQTVWNQEWERQFRSWLETQRRLILYRLQWGIPTGPYWSAGSLWNDEEYWAYLKRLMRGFP